MGNSGNPKLEIELFYLINDLVSNFYKAIEKNNYNDFKEYRKALMTVWNTSPFSPSYYNGLNHSDSVEKSTLVEKLKHEFKILKYRGRWEQILLLIEELNFYLTFHKDN